MSLFKESPQLLLYPFRSCKFGHDGDGEKFWRASRATENRKRILPRLDFVLETTTLKPHDSTTIEQNILDIRKVETSIETLKNKLKKYF